MEGLNIDIDRLLGHLLGISVVRVFWKPGSSLLCRFNRPVLRFPNTLSAFVKSATGGAYCSPSQKNVGGDLNKKTHDSLWELEELAIPQCAEQLRNVIQSKGKNK